MSQKYEQFQLARNFKIISNAIFKRSRWNHNEKSGEEEEHGDGKMS